MNGKFKNSIQFFSALFISALVISSCTSPSSEGFRDSDDAKAPTKEAEVKPASTKKDNLRGKTETEVFDGPVTTYEVNEEIHDFGDVEKGSKNPFTFVLTNTGDAPLVIEKAKGSCSCTVPKKPEDPIMPGETGEIEVTFKPKPSQKGNITQRVTITANTEPRETVLKIKATVQSDEEETPAAK